MSAPLTIESPQELHDFHIRAVVEAVLIGDFDALAKVDWELYDTQEWLAAAEYAEEANDYSDFTGMMERERVWQDWMRLSEREQDRWAGFGNYFDRMGPSILQVAA